MMTSLAFKYRLIPDVPQELEWRYLVSETLVGERCIIPLLEEITASPKTHAQLAKTLRRQIEEEASHVTLYEQLLGGEALRQQSYAPEFAAYVRELPSQTLKLFAMQAILEAISLAAIQYRLDAVELHPAEDMDRQILRDEEGHVRFGYAFLSDLKVQDGIHRVEDFHKVTRDVSAIFAKHFHGAVIAETIATSSAAQIESSLGMAHFRRKSARAILIQRNEFMERYFH